MNLVPQRGDTFQNIIRPINKIELINTDLSLSEFKYHFIIRRLPFFTSMLNNKKWLQIQSNIYLGFKAYFMGHNSIYIIQILNKYPRTDEVDLIVGLRRDQHALKFYREINVFEWNGYTYNVDLAQGFKAYVDQLNLRYLKQTANYQNQSIKIQNNNLLKNSNNTFQEQQSFNIKQQFVQNDLKKISSHKQIQIIKNNSKMQIILNTNMNNNQKNRSSIILSQYSCQNKQFKKSVSNQSRQKIIITKRPSKYEEKRKYHSGKNHSSSYSSSSSSSSPSSSQSSSSHKIKRKKSINNSSSSRSQRSSRRKKRRSHNQELIKRHKKYDRYKNQQEQKYKFQYNQKQRKRKNSYINRNNN